MDILDYPLELYADCRCKLSEGPLWDHRNKRMYWVDIPSHQVLRAPKHEPMQTGPGAEPWKPLTRNQLDIYVVGREVGAIALRKSGGHIVAVRECIASFDDKDGKTDPVSIPPGHSLSNRFNDAKVGPGGRYYAGTMSLQGEKEAGKLFLLHRDKTSETLVEGVTISNGLAWNKHEDTLYYIDTPTGRVDAFDYSKRTGEITNRRPAIEIPKELGHPDGMCIDDQDHLWIALFGGHAVIKADPVSGKILGKLEIPVKNVTCTAFGGPDRNELFITTAGGRVDGEPPEDQPAAGGVFRAKLDVTGPLSYEFGG